MRIFKKIFFLMLLAGLIVMPRSVGAKATDISIIEYGPTTISTKSGEKVEVIFKTNGVPDVLPTAAAATANNNDIGTMGDVEEIYQEEDGSAVYYRVVWTSHSGVDDVTITVTNTDNTNNTSEVIIIRSGAKSKRGVGGVCPNNDQGYCGTMKIDGTDVNLVCEGGECVAPPALRGIGTWCDSEDHDRQCDRGETGFDFTCSLDDYCVGSVAGIGCLNNDNTLNTHPILGKVAAELDSTERCDTGLVCDASKGRCENDFGQGKVPSDKLGDASKDIRDQISWKS